MTPRNDILVVGGGPWAWAIAWRAARRGATVGLIEDGGPAASDAAAGMLGPWSEALADEDADFRLHRAALAAWPAFVDDLTTDGGGPVLYEPGGTLFLAARPEDLGEVRRKAELLARVDRPVEWRPGSKLRSAEPALGSQVGGGVLLPQEAQVDPRRVLAALRSCALARGVELISARVSGVCEDGVATRGVILADGRTIDAAQVVLAAGWATGLVDDGVPLRPVKGQTIRLRWEDRESRPVERVVRTPSVYVVPRPDESVVVGATAEEGRDLTARTDGVHSLLDDAFRVLPALRETTFEGVSVGVRPATPDGRPAVGRGRADGLLWAVGGYRHGVLLTPWAADLLVDIAESSADDAPEGYEPGRFAARETACT